MVFCAKTSLTGSRAKFSSRVHLGLEASRMFRPTPRKKIWSHFVQSYFVRTLRYGTNFVQSYFVRTLAYGTWLRSLMNAPCLAWGRFGRCGQKTNTASCVYSAMIEGMRYKVYLLLQGLVDAPCYGFGPSSPCMHRVWIGVDSGVPVRKLTRYHMVFCAKSSLTCSRAKFSSRVRLDLEASRMFRTTPRKKFSLISCSRTLSGPWHTGLGSGLS